MNIINELSEIGKILDSVRLIEAIRSEVRKVKEAKGSMVIGGKEAERHLNNSSDYDVVIVNLDNKKTAKVLARRIKAGVKNIELDHFDNIIDSVIGVRTSKRMKEK